MSTDYPLPARTSTLDESPASPVRARPISPVARAALRRWWRRGPVKRALVVLHRWPALILGIVLVLETTSGSVLLYQGDIFRATNSHLYARASGQNVIEPDAAIDIVRTAHPHFDAFWVARDDGAYVVGDIGYKTLYFVDPTSGRINGSGNLDGGFMGWLANLHECAFSCEGYPWYASWLAEPVWEGGPTFLTDITWAGLTLGVLGCLLIVLALSSFRIWWPGRRRLKSRFVVRRRKGRFARDYDLHNVIGAAALPFILMWGVTGAAFEFPGVQKAWISITGGTNEADPDFYLEPEKVPKGTPQIDYHTAVEAALKQVPGTPTWVGRPTADTPYWEIDIDSGYGSQSYRAVYASDTYVLVDAHVATHSTVLYDARGKPAANRFYDKYFEPAHFGWQVNGWWRIVWFLMGLAPLALFVTGVSTWLYRRGVKKRRKTAGRPRLPDARREPDHLDWDGELDLAVDPGESR